jgi:riboflavin-specific deaminase-like protein
MLNFISSIPNLASTHFQFTNRPLVILSYAQTLDGSIAWGRGKPAAISSPETYAATHKLRASVDAILVGIGTVLSDDPRLTAREVAGSQPQPIVLDTHRRFPEKARLMEHPKPPWIISPTTKPDAAYKTIKVDKDGGRISLPALLDALGSAGIRSLMVEGGATVIESFLRAQLADQVFLTVTPRYFNGLRVFENNQAFTPVPRVSPIEIQEVGGDILMWGPVQYEEN